MEELLPYYERELAYLRKYARDFSEKYPKIAGRLLLSGDVSQDPHVERLIESFALLGARISKKIEDDYPDFTEALLEVLYPHYLRPFPSCSIAHFDAGAMLSQLSAPAVIPRGTEVQSRAVRGVTCRFRTSYDVTLAPIRLTEVSFKSIAQAPAAVRLPSQATGHISLKFDLVAEHSSVPVLGIEKIRLFTDGEPSIVAALRDALVIRPLAFYIEPTDSNRWSKCQRTPLEQVGFSDDESLIDFPARSHPAYRLITEYFCFPEKFGFFDLDLSDVTAAMGRSFTVHIILSGLSADSAGSRLLEGLTTSNLLLGCTPVVNLFEQHGEPIRVTHEAVSYPVVADARRAHAYEVHSIDSVKRVRQTAQGETITDFRPFYSLRHGENPNQTGHYWVAHRDELIAKTSPGYELELSVVDLDFNPVTPQTDVLSLELTCSNRDLPSQLAYRVPGGDLTLEGGSVARTISMLRKPTRAHRFETGRGAHWRLISHLSLNHVSLAQAGLGTLKEMLRLYDLPRTAISGQQIDGIVGLEHHPATVWLPGHQFASVVRGVEIRITLDENYFVGASISLFAQVLDRFFGLYVNANSFIQLVIISKESGEVLIKCSARSGESILV
jgi:type VI secretion system protein ImpG